MNSQILLGFATLHLEISIEPNKFAPSSIQVKPKMDSREEVQALGSLANKERKIKVKLDKMAAEMEQALMDLPHLITKFLRLRRSSPETNLI